MLASSRIVARYQELQRGLECTRATYCYQRLGSHESDARKIYDKHMKMLKGCSATIEREKKDLDREIRKYGDALTGMDKVLSMLGLAKEVIALNRRCDKVFDILYTG